MRVVHEGRGGYVEVDGRRYAIEHVEGGRFCVHFPGGQRHAWLEDDRAALEGLVASAPGTWSLA